MEKSRVLNAYIPRTHAHTKKKPIMTRPLAHTKKQPTRTGKLSKTIVTTANVTMERPRVLNAFVPGITEYLGHNKGQIDHGGQTFTDILGHTIEDERKDCKFHHDGKVACSKLKCQTSKKKAMANSVDPDETPRYAADVALMTMLSGAFAFLMFRVANILDNGENGGNISRDTKQSLVSATEIRTFYITRLSEIQ
ncbi:hypothetical protein DPMN_171164, partial [Dreissena polymorpha]